MENRYNSNNELTNKSIIEKGKRRQREEEESVISE